LGNGGKMSLELGIVIGKSTAFDRKGRRLFYIFQNELCLLADNRLMTRRVYRFVEQINKKDYCPACGATLNRNTCLVG